MSQREQGRRFLRSDFWKTLDFSATPQALGVAPPPLEKPAPPEMARVSLPGPGTWQGVEPLSVEAAIAKRTTLRRYAPISFTLDELSFLLWATQGIREVLPGGNARRTVPSGGCRHALETYLAVFRVDGLEKGVYRYLPLSHELLVLGSRPDLEDALVAATRKQVFPGRSAVTFAWTALPERGEWRYAEAAAKLIALDAGHVCQNLYLACEAVGAGTCAIAAYDQELADALLGVDGKDEFTVYMASVGKKPEE